MIDVEGLLAEGDGYFEGCWEVKPTTRQIDSLYVNAGRDIRHHRGVLREQLTLLIPSLSLGVCSGQAIEGQAC